MKFTCLRLVEIAAATLVSSAVLLVAVTPAVIGAPVRLSQLDYSHVQVQVDSRPNGSAGTLAT